jgi:hypothetical protein
VIRSPELSKHVSKYVEEEFLPGNSWQDSIGHNPDSEAKLKKRIKAASRRILPKKIL